MVDTLTKVQIRIYSNKYSTNKTVAVKIITSENDHHSHDDFADHEKDKFRLAQGHV